MIYALRHRDGYSDVGARKNQWKISRVGQGPWKLFDIVQDRGETHDMSAQHPERLSEMISQTEEWSHSHTEPRWFHESKARDTWKRTGMPNFDKTLLLVPSSAPNDAEPVTKSTAKGDSTKAEFVAREQVKWEKNGWVWNLARAEEIFDEIDSNKDGIASGIEKRAFWSK